MTALSHSFIHHALDEAASQRGSATALVHRDREVSYQALRGLACSVASRLKIEGIGRQDVVLLEANKTPMTVACLYGALAVGAIVCPVARETPNARKDYLAENAGARRYLVGVDQSGQEDTTYAPLERLMLSESDTATDVNKQLADYCPALLATDPALLIYTSGTTAQPKGICGLHFNVSFVVSAIAQRLHYQQSDRILCFLPFSFDYGLYQIFLGFHAGATCFLAEERDSKIGITKLLRQTGATVLPAVAPIIEQFALLAGKIDDLPALRLITNTGAPIRTQTLRRVRDQLPHVRFQAMYGLTECKRATIAEPDADIDKPGTCGTALPGTEVLIRDDEGQPAPDGSEGEIVIRGPHVMAGYWDAPELTAEKFGTRYAVLKELYTGDIGHLDADGHLFCSGRKDDQFKQNGFRTSCSEIEAAALTVPGVNAATVLSPSDANKRLAVLFVTGYGESRAIQEALADQIDSYKIPGSCIAVDAMPLTANGKVDKKALIKLT